MSRSKIIIHLGAHKTATTTIQSHLDANYNSLLEQGILALTPPYPGKDDDRVRAIFGRNKPLKKHRNRTGIFSIFNHKYFQIRARRAAYFRELVKEKCGSSWPRKIIVSEENLIGEKLGKDTFGLYSPPPAAFSRLVLLEKILGQSPDEIHFTIRSYDTFLPSVYASNTLHSKKLQPPFESIRKAWCTSVPRGWVDVVTDIKKIFPESILKLSVYERDSVEERLKSIVGPGIRLPTIQHGKQLHMMPSVEAINARNIQIRNHYLRVTPGYELIAKHANGKKFDPLTKQEKTLLASRYDEDVASLKRQFHILNSP